MTEGPDHLAPVVRAGAASRRCYREVSGTEAVTCGGGRQGLACGRQRINLQQAGGPGAIGPRHPTPGAGDRRLASGVPPEDVVERLRSRGVRPGLGPVPRTGAPEHTESGCVRGPDGNLAEIARHPARAPLVRPGGGLRN